LDFAHQGLLLVSASKKKSCAKLKQPQSTNYLLIVDVKRRKYLIRTKIIISSHTQRVSPLENEKEAEKHTWKNEVNFFLKLKIHEFDFRMVGGFSGKEKVVKDKKCKNLLEFNFHLCQE
jgi:hypothetical protein